MTTDDRDLVRELIRWKAEALAVIARWELVADLVEQLEPCPVGSLRSEHARRVLEQLAVDAGRLCRGGGDLCAGDEPHPIAGTPR